MLSIGGPMKLEHAILVAVAVALGGCASSASSSSRAPLVPMTDAVSTTTITSSLEPTAEESDAPRVSKAQRSLDGDAQLALDGKKTASREGKRQHAFADYK
jgi:hypothetical protein